jgi:natural product precursor
MKKLKKLKLNELRDFLPVLTEGQLRDIFGGWYCFSACLDYLGVSGAMFNHYYNNLFGNIESLGGASSQYIETVLGFCGITYTTPSTLYASGNGRQIIAINNGTHAVIYKSGTVNNGKLTVTYFDPQTQQEGTYTYGSTTISVVNIL